MAAHMDDEGAKPEQVEERMDAFRKTCDTSGGEPVIDGVRVSESVGAGTPSADDPMGTAPAEHGSGASGSVPEVSATGFISSPVWSGMAHNEPMDVDEAGSGTPRSRPDGTEDDAAIAAALGEEEDGAWSEWFRRRGRGRTRQSSHGAASRSGFGTPRSGSAKGRGKGEARAPSAVQHDPVAWAKRVQDAIVELGSEAWQVFKQARVDIMQQTSLGRTLCRATSLR